MLLLGSKGARFKSCRPKSIPSFGRLLVINGWLCGIPGRNISSWGRKSDLKICPEAETIRPKMTIRPLDEQALRVKDNEL